MLHVLNFKTYYCLWFLFVLTFALAGCTTTIKEIRATIETSSTIQPTKIGQSIEITTPATVMPTQTSSKLIATFTPTLLPSPIATKPVATATITPFPTLSIDQEEIVLNELMQTNGNCDLPCWWGVTPGSTTAEVAKELFMSQGVFWNDGYVDIGRPRYVGVNSEFIVEDAIVQQIVANGTRDHYDLAYRFTETWQRYTVAEMLKQYGMPSHVFLNPPIAAEAGVPNEYGLLLYFVSSDMRATSASPVRVSTGSGRDSSMTGPPATSR